MKIEDIMDENEPSASSTLIEEATAAMSKFVKEKVPVLYVRWVLYRFGEGEKPGIGESLS